MSSLTLESVQKQTTCIWHGVNSSPNLKLFLESSILWGEGDVRTYDPGKGDVLVCRHDPFEERPLEEGEPLFHFEDYLDGIIKNQKKFNIDVKEGGPTLKKLIATFKARSVPDTDISFNINLLYASFDEIAGLHKDFPDSILQTPVPLSWMRQEMPEEQAQAFYNQLKKVGITRLSISWEDPPTQKEIDRIRQNNFTLNLYNVDTLEIIQKAMVFKPETLTSDFNIPEWGLAGQGSGEKNTKSLKGLDKHFVKS